MSFELPNIPSANDLSEEMFTWFDETVTAASIVSPTEICRTKGTKIPASDLECGKHFKAMEIKQHLDENQMETLFGGLRSNLTHFNKELTKSTQVIQVVAECSLSIMKKFYRCGEIRNRTELRYVVGDPIMEMLCDTFQLHVKLEETVQHNLQHSTSNISQQSGPNSRSQLQITSPGIVVSQAVTPLSRADYTCYTLRPDNESVAVLVIETKMSTRAQHAVAQVLGYFIAFCTVESVPPLVFILTDRFVRLVILPFKYGINQEICLAVDGILMPDIPLWVGSKFNEQLLLLLLIVGKIAVFGNSVDFKKRLLEYPKVLGPATPKRQVCSIATEEETREELKVKLRTLEERAEIKLRTLEERVEKAEQEVRALKARKDWKL